jgi:hypothetical protein
MTFKFLKTANMTRFTSIATIFAAFSLAHAQSVDPGLGTNPNAQGATEDVTPGSGPNG